MGPEDQGGGKGREGNAELQVSVGDEGEAHTLSQSTAMFSRHELRALDTRDTSTVPCMATLTHTQSLTLARPGSPRLAHQGQRRPHSPTER